MKNLFLLMFVMLFTTASFTSCTEIDDDGTQTEIQTIDPDESEDGTVEAGEEEEESQGN